MYEPTTTISGNLTADPELRITTSGIPVASFTIASTPRYRDGASGEWRDGETWFCRCSAWRDLGENLAGSLHRGQAVVATGRLRARSWQTEDGSTRTVVEMTVDDAGPSLKRATARVIKTTRESAGDGDGPRSRPVEPWDRWAAREGERAPSAPPQQESGESDRAVRRAASSTHSDPWATSSAPERFDSLGDPPF